MRRRILSALGHLLNKKVQKQCRYINCFEDIVALQSWEKQMISRLSALSVDSDYKKLFLAAYRMLTTNKDTEWCARYYK